MATAFLVGPLAIVQGIYAKYFGLPLTTIATILLVARVFDAVSDPLIGFYSDRYHARTGSRKPFVLCGGLLLVISSYFLYVPVDFDTLQTLEGNAVPITVSSGYFLGWFLAFYLAWTLFEIPHMAWGSELASSSQGKTLVYSLRAAAALLGISLFYAVPLLPIFSSNSFTPQSLVVAVLFAGILMLVLLYCCIKYTPKGEIKPPTSIALEGYNQTLASKLKMISHEIMSNRILLLFLLAVTFSTIGIGGMWFTLIFIYVDAYLELGEYFAKVSLLAVFISIFMTSVWYFLAARLGKITAVVLGLLASVIGVFLTGFLEQGQSTFLSLLLVMILCYGIGAVSVMVLAPSLLGDIIDYSRLRYGRDRAATYFSLYTMVAKMSQAIGGALGLAVAGHYGFDPAADTYTAENITGLRLAIAWLPAGFVLCSIVLFLINPLTARRHALIRKRLDARDCRAALLANTQQPLYPTDSNQPSQDSFPPGTLNNVKS